MLSIDSGLWRLRAYNDEWEAHMVDAHKRGRIFGETLASAGYGPKYAKFAAKKQASFCYNSADLRDAFIAGFGRGFRRVTAGNTERGE